MTRRTALAAVGMTLLVACSGPPSTSPSSAPSGAGVASVTTRPTAHGPLPTRTIRPGTDGPHSPASRVPAATTVSQAGSAIVSDFDLGDLEIGLTPGSFRTPVRGVLVLPAATTAPAPLVVIAHLRTENCVGATFAYPCPSGDLRHDRGMTWLGEALAARGYATLIPDLGPVFISGQSELGYDQRNATIGVLDQMRDALAAPSASNTFQTPLVSRIDLSSAALFGHSRGGLFTTDIAAAWASGPTPITSVLTYGAAYDPPTPSEPGSAFIGDLPYLALLGDQDGDVGRAPAVWLTEHLTERRTTPAALAMVPGLGHNYINRTASSAHSDDRKSCSAACPDAAAHEAFLARAAVDWLDATVRHMASPLSSLADPTAPPPGQVGGLPARWVAVTPTSTVLFSADHGPAPTASGGASARLCRLYDPQDPARPDRRCPDQDLADLAAASNVGLIRLPPGGSVSIPVVGRARTVVLQLAPALDRSDASGTALKVGFIVDGQSAVVDVPADGTLLNRSTPDMNGSYLVGAVRVAVPASITGQLTAITLASAQGDATLIVRSIDGLGA